jgi:hypothetical protein
MSTPRKQAIFFRGEVHLMDPKTAKGIELWKTMNSKQKTELSLILWKEVLSLFGVV